MCEASSLRVLISEGNYTQSIPDVFLLGLVLIILVQGIAYEIRVLASSRTDFFPLLNSIRTLLESKS